MKPIGFLTKAAVSLLFFALIFRVVGSDDLAGLAGQVRWEFVLLSCVASVAMIAVSCLKWYVLLRHQNTPVPFRSLFRFYLIGYYFTCLLPSNVGGDVARSYYAGRRIGSQSAAAVSVFLERISGLALLLILVPAAPLFRRELYVRPAIWIPAGGAVLLFLLLVLLVRARQPLRRLLGAVAAWRDRGGGRTAQAVESVLSRVRGKALGFHDKLKTALKALRRDRHVLAPVLALTLLFYALTWANVWISFRAFDAFIPFLDVAAVTPAAMMVAMIPIAPLASLGLAEGVYVFYFGLVGAAPAAALGMGLLLRCKLLLIGLVGLLLHLTLQDRAVPAVAST